MGVGRGGSIRWQDASTARSRQPTIAEARQRVKTRKAREDSERFAEEQERQGQQRAASWRKVLMGSVAVVGLVGAVALGYHLPNDEDEVAATCVRDGTNEVVSDSYCTSGNVGSGGVRGVTGVVPAGDFDRADRLKIDRGIPSELTGVPSEVAALERRG